MNGYISCGKYWYVSGEESRYVSSGQNGYLSG